MAKKKLDVGIIAIIVISLIIFFKYTSQSEEERLPHSFLKLPVMDESFGGFSVVGDVNTFEEIFNNPSAYSCSGSITFCRDYCVGKGYNKPESTCDGGPARG